MYMKMTSIVIALLVNMAEAPTEHIYFRCQERRTEWIIWKQTPTEDIKKNLKAITGIDEAEDVILTLNIMGSERLQGELDAEAFWQVYSTKNKIMLVTIKQPAGKFTKKQIEIKMSE